jgi:hypothetical protein
MNDQMYGQMADSLMKHRFLNCRICKKESHPTRNDIILYLQFGWPVCCGEVMSLEKDEWAKLDDMRADILENIGGIENDED